MTTWRAIAGYRAYIASAGGLLAGVLCSTVVQRRLPAPRLATSLDEEAWREHCRDVRSAAQRLPPALARPLRLPEWAFNDTDEHQIYRENPVVFDVQSLNRRVDFIRTGAILTLAIGLAGIGGFCYAYFVGFRAPCCAKEMRKAQRTERQARQAARREESRKGTLGKGPVEVFL
eukprot:GEMP01103857.1.p1 GENE.GEMP01103857.1~~GEMP01103857.1.p1  ORF type:complete len:174 (+),score=34.36 GEMP01103857.1:150-671(+)